MPASWIKSGGSIRNCRSDASKRLPELLVRSPVMSLGYSDGSKVAVLDALDKEGNPVIAAILP